VAAKKFVFHCVRTVEQTMDVVIKAGDADEAEEKFSAKREETDDFSEGDWENGDPTGPLDWDLDEE
jgi:hypothetical protein